MNSEEKRPTAEEFEGEKLPYPAKQSEMRQQPDSDLSNYKPAGKLTGKVAIVTGAIFERAVNDNLRTSARAWKWWLELGSREDISAEIGQINVPVLVAAGENDDVMTPELLEYEIVRRIENAQLIVVPAVKHILPLEALEKIADLIREHCETVG